MRSWRKQKKIGGFALIVLAFATIGGITAFIGLMMLLMYIYEFVTSVLF